MLWSSEWRVTTYCWCVLVASATTDSDGRRRFGQAICPGAVILRVVRPTTPCACFSEARGVYRWGRASV